MIINEKYLIYFYILSFFLLISLMLLYKKSKNIKKIITFIAIIILVVQAYIVYDTYPLMEHLTNEEGIELIKKSVAKFYETDEKANKLINLNETNPLGNAYAGARTLFTNQSGTYKGDTDLLTDVNQATGKNYNVFVKKNDDLANIKGLPTYKPSENEFHMNTFTKPQIGNIMTNIGRTYLNSLDQLILDTNPIARP